jgi:hypothetical protein
MYTTDFRSLLKYCIKTHQSISQVLERSVINEMKNNPQVGYTWAETVAHLRVVQAKIHTPKCRTLGLKLSDTYE